MLVQLVLLQLYLPLGIFTIVSAICYGIVLTKSNKFVEEKYKEISKGLIIGSIAAFLITMAFMVLGFIIF